MSVSDKSKQELRDVLAHVIGKGYNLTVHRDEQEPILYSQDIDALMSVVEEDTFQVYQVHQSRTLIGTFVVDLEMHERGERLVSSYTRSLNHLFA